MSWDRIQSARAALQAGQRDDAASVARDILKDDPASIDALEILALVARERGEHDAAERELRHILSLAPDARWARDDLTRLLLDAGKPAEAEAEARTSLAIGSDDADAHGILGGLLSERESLVEGAWHLRRAIALAGRHPQLLANLARNLMRQGALEDASAIAAEAAAAATPGLLANLALMAEIAERRGDFDAAWRILDRAEPIARREGRDVMLLRATLLSRGSRWQEALDLLDGLPAMHGAARLLRARLRDRAGRYQEAWADCVAGKAALAEASKRRYDAAAVEAHFAELAAAGRIETPRARRRDGPQPLFILGMPRSGTTMVEQVLSSHSAIHAGGELPFVAELVGFADRMLCTAAPFPAKFGQLAAADHHHFPALFRDFYLARAEVHGLTRRDVAFFTDKMPVNEIYLPLIRLAFPDAPMIAVRRHPLDILVSIMMHDLTHGFDCGYRIEDAAHQLAAVSALTAHYDAPAYRFSYERFVADQAGETDQLMAYVGLAAEPAQSRFHESRRHAPTPSYAQVREPLHDRSVGRWKNYRAELASVVPIVAEAMQRDGYEA